MPVYIFLYKKCSKFQNTENTLILSASCEYKHFQPFLQYSVKTTSTTTSFLQAGCPSCCPINSDQSLKGKVWYSMDLLTSSSSGIFQPRCWPLKAAGYLGGWLQGSHQPFHTRTRSFNIQLVLPNSFTQKFPDWKNTHQSYTVSSSYSGSVTLLTNFKLTIMNLRIKNNTTRQLLVLPYVRHTSCSAI